MGDLPSAIGRFRPIARIATTGLSETFAARIADAPAHAPVALKRISPSLAAVEGARAAFAHEAMVLGRMNHVGIVRAIDLTPAASDGHFAIELVRGQRLVDVVRRCEAVGLRLPVRHAIGIVATMAEALDHAHTATDVHGRPLGIVHADLSPNCITIEDGGAVLLTDFAGAHSDHPTVDRRRWPQPAAVAYMSPEQSRGEPFDRRSDIYVLGVLLWELATWSRLYARLPVDQIIARVAIGAVPLPTQVRADFPSELEDVLMIALQPAPHRRFTSAGDLARALRRLAGPADPRSLDGWIRRVFH
jgi:serine/threonine-protein kinase